MDDARGHRAAARWRAPTPHQPQKEQRSRGRFGPSAVRHEETLPWISPLQEKPMGGRILDLEQLGLKPMLLRGFVRGEDCRGALASRGRSERRETERVDRKSVV